MSIKVILYGDLKKKIEETSQRTNIGIPLKLNIIKKQTIKNVDDLLKNLKLSQEEISHVFVNGKYCGLGKEIKDGDRIGFFPRNMGINFVEIEKNNSIPIYINIPENLQMIYHPSKGILHLPTGSTLGYLLKKLNISELFDKLEISINNEGAVNKESILKEDDRVKIKYL